MRYRAPVLALGAIAVLTAAPARPEGAGSAALAASTVDLCDDAVRDWRRARTFETLENALDLLVLQYCERARRLECGSTRSGRPLLAVEIAPRERTVREGAPAFLVLPGLERDASTGAAEAFELVRSLLEREPAEEFAHDPLVRATLIVVVAPRPDDIGRATTGADLAHDFPIAWDPWLDGDPGPGPYPLSEPESRALAHLVLARTDLAACLVLGARGPSLAVYAALGAPDADLGVFLDLSRSAVLYPRGFAPVRNARPGGFAEFVYGRAGIPVFGRPPAARPEQTAGVELALETLATQAASLSIGEARLERLGTRLWQVEVEVSNDGLLATTSAMAAEQRILGEPSLVVSGLPVSACALERDGTFHLLRGVGGEYRIPDLGGGESRVVRIVVAGDAGSVLKLAVDAPRAWGARRAVELR